MDAVDRRTYLAVLAGGTLVLAGCSGEEEEREDPSREDSDEGESSVDEDETNGEGGENGENGEREETEDDESEAADREIGERIEIDEFAAVVADFDRVEEFRPSGIDDDSLEPDDVLEASDGSAFAVVDVAVQYHGDEPVVDVDESLAVALVDDDGEEYERIEASDEWSFDPTVARLAPGEVVRGELGFEIDDAADELVLSLESTVADDVVLVDLESAVGEDSATVLEQELTDVAGVGSQVEAADVEITVASLQQGNNLGGFMQSEEGYDLVALGIVLENESGGERTLSTDQAQLADEFGRRYPEDPGALRALEGFDEAVVDDGEEYDGSVAYQVEEGVGALYWAFDLDAWDENRRLFWTVR
ncbi:DUF4352 domain-containing protein [Natrarchaeobius sp. A-rgal3]|uniref:DUF4352 domain-containing protein n=1 Tax=Natrarchaeobius versutus TaxID=1679078 RepID=UPI003510275C